MFEPITIPFGAVMLFNVVKLKAGVSVADVELALGGSTHQMRKLGRMIAESAA